MSCSWLAPPGSCRFKLSWRTSAYAASRTGIYVMADPPPAVGTPGVVGLPGSGEGVFGSPVPEVAELHPARMRHAETARLNLTCMADSLEGADRGLLNDDDRKRLLGKGAGDFKR